MKIYDCFIFNNEFDLLELRLNFLYKQVDYFVLAEAPRTLSGIRKPLHYKEHEDRYSKYADKIIYVEVPLEEHLEAWDYEFFQRNSIKNGLNQCKDDDLIFISDVDEILNISVIMSKYVNRGFQLPALIELSFCYYYFNLEADHSLPVNLVSKYGFLKDKDIGRRYPYSFPISGLISRNNIKTGWHFSYLFGENVSKYQNKIESFSHQEYNNDQFKNPELILHRVRNGLDLYDRPYNFYFRNNSFLKEIYPNIVHLKQEYLIKKLTLKDQLKSMLRNFHVLLYNLKMKIKSKSNVQ